MSTANLTRAQREAIARAIAAGASPADLAVTYALTPTEVRTLTAGDGMRQLIKDEQQRLVDAGSRLMFKFLMRADQLADDQLAEAMDPKSPNQYKARTWILERVMADRRAHSGDVHLHMSMAREVVDALTAAVQGAAKAIGEHTMDAVPLVDGRKALPSLVETELEPEH